MRWLRLLPLVVVVVLSVLWALPPSGLDFAVYWRGGHDVLVGLSPYRELDSLPFTYPAFSAVLFVPFALLPEHIAYVVWQVLIIAALIVATLIVAERSGLDAKVATWLLAGSMLLQPVVRDIQLGQINTVIVLLVVVDLFVLPKRYRGLLIGVAAGIKLTPAVFAVLFLFRREWASALRAVAAGLGTILLPALVIPADTLLYWTKLIFDPSRIGGADYGDNQSLVGVIARAMNGSKPPTLVTLPVEIIVLALACWLAWQFHVRRDEVGAMLAVALGSLLVSPVSWSHHWVWVVPALAWLVARRSWVWAGLLAAVTLVTHLFLPDNPRLAPLVAELCYDLLPAVGLALLVAGLITTRAPRSVAA
ncbi:MAG: glycosyltransferase 87 family protein [Propionibacteriaceae bacterium]|nr:DUF2029 domain-containing protein [Micropruina sp.]HBX79738.1 hypothetical protein [Propionibacteriaceae bacterium]HBY24615.1 hypothetical protein [Propionibacteriaceae bacterium]